MRTIIANKLSLGLLSTLIFCFLVGCNEKRINSGGITKNNEINTSTIDRTENGGEGDSENIEASEATANTDPNKDSEIAELVKLMYLAYGKKWKVLSDRLDSYSGDINIVDPYKQSLLHLVCYGNDTHLVRKVIRRNADINYVDPSGVSAATALQIAVYKGNRDVILILLEEGAEINLQNEVGMTALMTASTCNHDMAEILLEHGANPNIQDESGWSALHHLLMSIPRPDVEVVKEFLKYGANPLLRNPDPSYGDSSLLPQQAYPTGETPLEIAQDGGYAEIIALFEDWKPE